MLHGSAKAGSVLFFALQCWLSSQSFAFQLSPSHSLFTAASPLRHACRRGPSISTTVRCAQSQVSGQDQQETVLRLVEGTDRGADASKLPQEKRVQLYAAIEALEAQNGDADLIQNDAALGFYEVVWTGRTRAEDEISGGPSAAGGYWRGRLGRTIFKTEGLFQHVIRLDAKEVPPYARIGQRDAYRRKGLEVPNRESELMAVNMVCATLLGLLRVTVVLCGIVQPLRREELGEVAEIGARRMKGQTLPAPSRNTARVDYAPPLIALGGGRLRGVLRVSIGPSSEVFLDTTHACPRLRLARGATSGTRFAFRRLPPPSPSDLHGAWRSVASSGVVPPLPAKLLGALCLARVAASLLSASLLLLLPPPVLEPARAVLLGVVGGAGVVSTAGWWATQGALSLLGGVLWQAGGGIVQNQARRSEPP